MYDDRFKNLLHCMASFDLSKSFKFYWEAALGIVVESPQRLARGLVADSPTAAFFGGGNAKKNNRRIRYKSSIFE
ncbi:hypothetical protein GCM10022260_16700 [Gaetbulibacter aestuarii]